MTGIRVVSFHLSYRGNGRGRGARGLRRQAPLGDVYAVNSPLPGFRGSSFAPPGGVSPTAGTGGARAPSAPLSFLPCGHALQPSALCSCRPTSTQPAELSLARGPQWGSLCPGRLRAGRRRRVLEVAVESGLLISGGTSNWFHASGVSCQ